MGSILEHTEESMKFWVKLRQKQLGKGRQAHRRRRSTALAGCDEGRDAEPIGGPLCDCIAENAIYDYVGRSKALLRV